MSSANPYGVHFKPDGTKMYAIDPTADRVYEYDLSTAWAVSTASSVQSFSVVAQDNFPTDVVFKPDGTKMYICGTGSDSVHEYNLSTPWDVSTSVFSQSFDCSSMVPNPIAISLKSDGTKLVVSSQNAGFEVTVGYDLSVAWDISTATYSGGSGTTTGTLAYIGAQEGNPYGMFFKSDGTKVYTLGANSDAVHEYDLSSAWDLQTISFNQSFSISSQAPSSEGLFFRSDGIKMYVVCSTNDTVYEYDLSVAWDVSSASYSTKSFSVATQQTTPRDLFFKSDGTKMYVIGWTSQGVSEYDLSSAWDVSTATHLQNFSVGSQESLPQGLFFKSDGTEMYVVGISGDDLNKYTLSSAWDVSTATFNSATSLQITNNTFIDPQAVHIDSSGTRLYVLYAGFIDSIVGHTMSSAWNPATLSPDFTENFYFNPTLSSTEAVKISPDGTCLISIDFGTIERRALSSAWDVGTTSGTRTTFTHNLHNTPLGLYLKSDGSQFHVSGGGPSYKAIATYNMTGSTWDITTAVWFSPSANYSNVVTQENVPRGVSFKTDGTKMYVIGQQGDDVNEYDLSSAWDITTASFLQTGSVSAQDTTPTNLFFKPDGTKMYMTGDAGNDINEYDLSSAWDVSTLSFVQSLAASTTAPTGVFFKSDGLTMFVCGGTLTNSEVIEFTLSSAWDISTATETQSISLWFSAQAPSSNSTDPKGIFFKPDGTKMYTLGGSSGTEFGEFTLSSAWDISTASRTAIFQDLNTIPRSGSGLFFKSDGTKFFAVCTEPDELESVFAYDIISA